ncbi:MAG: ceramidase domain-containing protein [Alphaproteobacteria bacterium]|nr:ceramidase domain-containing protein [Alphaproteobacteria bacterium]
MAWSEQIFRYCERGSDPEFWAEPVNALTNTGFILVGILAAGSYAQKPLAHRDQRDAVLIALVFTIGLGSFLFHTFATRWASAADVGPIGLFMLAYFAYALRKFVELSWLVVGLSVAAFIGALHLFGEMSCQPSFMPVSNALGVPCLNGTAGYIPALLAMLVVGFVLRMKGHPAWRYLVGAGCIFSLSMAFRTLDFEICDGSALLGARIGTHFVWHLLNAIVLYLLLHAALFHGSQQSHQ